MRRLNKLCIEVQEEFNLCVEMMRYLGSIVSEYQVKGVNIQKTTLYFLCKLNNFSKEKRNMKDPESSSKIMWEDINFLIEKMKKQRRRLNRSDADESDVLVRAKKYL